MSELLPCPWCGKKPELAHYETFDNDEWAVACVGECCEIQPATNSYFTREQAIEAWNTRAERTCYVVKKIRTLHSTFHGDVEVTEEKCSECGKYMEVGFGVIRNYCPNCGAKVVMRNEPRCTSR